MTLRKFLENIEEIVKNNPECLDLIVINSEDDEGNGYNEVYYSPSLGNFDEGEFISEDDLNEYELSKEDINSICIN